MARRDAAAAFGEEQLSEARASRGRNSGGAELRRYASVTTVPSSCGRRPDRGKAPDCTRAEAESIKESPVMPVVARRSEPSCGSCRAIGVALVAVCCAVVVAACGSSSPNTASGSESGTSPQFALARCMRAHSVPNFPDPTLGAGGEGFSIAKSPGSSSVTVDGISFSGPAFRADALLGRLGAGTTGPAPSDARSQRRCRS
jgi:hypothetical protein